MADNSNSKDKALEALDFIINVLKEHEESLDKSIDALTTITEQIGDLDSLNGKMEKVEEEISGLQKDVANLITRLSSHQQEIQSAFAKEPTTPLTQTTTSISPYTILGCKQWTDFQTFASNAQKLSYNYKEGENVFQANALKGDQIITYSGILPNFSIILRAWLSLQLGVMDQNIFEGFLEKR